MIERNKTKRNGCETEQKAEAIPADVDVGFASAMVTT